MRDDELLTDLAEVIGTVVEADRGPITPKVRLDEDLGIDSLSFDVVVALEDRFGLVIPDDVWSRFRAIGDIAAYRRQAAVLRR